MATVHDLRKGLSDEIRYGLFAAANTTQWEPPLEPLLDSLMSLPQQQRTLLALGPHDDDATIGAGALLYDLCRHGARVVVLVLYSGHRVAGVAQARPEHARVELRLAEARLDGLCLEAQLLHLQLPSYEVPGYEPSPGEFDTVVEKVRAIRPGAVLCPPANDRHSAHRAARALLAVALLENQFDIPIFAYASPWGHLAQLTHYHVFGAATAQVKDRALRAHVSQYEAHYPEYVRARDHAPLSLLPQLTQGHYVHNGSEGHGAGLAQAAGAELFCQLTYDPNSSLPTDPLLVVQGMLRNQLSDDVLVSSPRLQPAHQQEPRPNRTASQRSPQRGKNAGSPPTPA